MAKFKMKVIIKAQVEYEVEVEAATEWEAEDRATGMWRQMTPDDFQVEKGYITDWDVDHTEQLTADCERCGIEYPLLDFAKHPEARQPWKEDNDFCAPCGVEIEAEEAAEKAGKR